MNYIYGLEYIQILHKVLSCREYGLQVISEGSLSLASQEKIIHPWLWNTPELITHVQGSGMSLDTIFWPPESTERTKVGLDPTILLYDNIGENE